jgi:plastocyanin
MHSKLVNPKVSKSGEEKSAYYGVVICCDCGSNVLQTSDTFEHKFTNTGEYYYYCTIHPWRIGVSWRGRWHTLL